MTRPITLTIVVILQWVAAVLGLIAAVFLLLGAGTLASRDVRDQITEALKTETADLPVEITGATVGWGLLFIGLFVVVVSVLRIVIAMSLARGHAWARIVLTIFVAFSLIGAIAELFQGGGAMWRGIVTIIVEIVILWLMWNAKSSAYIAAKGLERAMEKVK
jgi:hypothetical protein